MAPEALIDALFAGLGERPMWGSFLARLAERMGADIAGFVLSPDLPGSDDAAVLVPVGVRTQALLAGIDAAALDAMPDGVAVALPEALALRIELPDRRSGWLVARGHAALAGDVLGALVPALRRALPLYRVIGASERRRLVAEHVLETSGVGVILVAADRRVVSINTAAQAIIRHGGVLRLAGNRIEALNAADQRALARAIREKAGEQKGEAGGETQVPLALLRDHDALPVTVMVRPGPPFGPVSAPLLRTATVVLRDPARRVQLASADCIDLFQMTPAEARLACLLADGASLDECAIQLGVSRNTARSQLQAVFAKTNTRRQGDLVRLLLTAISPVPD